jgi:hypothetical protein
MLLSLNCHALCVWATWIEAGIQEKAAAIQTSDISEPLSKYRELVSDSKVDLLRLEMLEISYASLRALALFIQQSAKTGISLDASGIEYTATLHKSKDLMRLWVLSNQAHFDDMKQGWFVDPALAMDISKAMLTYVTVVLMGWKDLTIKIVDAIKDKLPPKSLTDDPHLLDTASKHDTLGAMLDQLTDLSEYKSSADIVLLLKSYETDVNKFALEFTPAKLDLALCRKLA